MLDPGRAGRFVTYGRISPAGSLLRRACSGVAADHVDVRDACFQEFLADDAEVYSVVLPASSQSFTAARSMPCVKQDAGAYRRMDGRWMNVVFMSLGKTPYFV